TEQDLAPSLGGMTTLTAQTSTGVLTDAMLSRFHDRAPTHDRENRFFDEDFEELRQSGYLKLAVPQDLGGSGMKLAQIVREQRRLAYHAPATALAVNMHLYWTGVAADLRRTVDSSCEWILRQAADGEVFAAGHTWLRNQGHMGRAGHARDPQRRYDPGRR